LIFFTKSEEGSVRRKTKEESERGVTKVGGSDNTQGENGRFNYGHTSATRRLEITDVNPSLGGERVAERAKKDVNERATTPSPHQKAK